MTHIEVILPETISSVLHCGPDELTKEVQLAAALQWYQQGRFSQELAANIAGLDRTDFLLMLASLKKDSFQVDFEDLDHELARGE